MCEKPKSIWRKSWNLPRPFLLLSRCLLLTVLVLVVALLAMFGTSWLTRGGKDWEAFIVVILVAGVSAGVALLYMLIRRLCCWRNLRRFLFASVCVVTLIALFYAVENWRGDRAWKAFQREMAARGEPLEMTEVVPPPVPNDQNFALADIFMESFGWYWNREKRAAMSANTNFVDPLDIGLWRRNSGTNDPKSFQWEKGLRADLESWQQYYRTAVEVRIPSFSEKVLTNDYPVAPQPQTPAADVLLALSRFDPALKQIRQAAGRPFSRFPLNYGDHAGTLLPHLSKFKMISLTLQLRAIASLAAGRPEQAFEDVELALRLADAIKTEPILISHLVRIAMLNLTLHAVWEGLADQRWSESQLAALQNRFEGINFLAEYVQGMRGERAMFNLGLDEASRLRLKSSIADFLLEPENYGKPDQRKNWAAVLYLQLAPRGWFRRNQVFYSRQVQQRWIGAVNPASRTIHADHFMNLEHPVQISRNTYNLLAANLLAGSDLDRMIQKSVRAQAHANLAATACALERHRLAHGAYPESLVDLVPRFMEKLPHDLINGQPLKYRRTDDGLFILYSIGWDQKDDGGMYPVPKEGQSESGGRRVGRDRIEEGDWVWRYPTN